MGFRRPDADLQLWDISEFKVPFLLLGGGVTLFWILGHGANYRKTASMTHCCLGLLGLLYAGHVYNQVHRVVNIFEPSSILMQFSSVGPGLVLFAGGCVALAFAGFLSYTVE